MPTAVVNWRTAVFRIFQEILTNIARHAEATQVFVTLAVTPSVCASMCATTVADSRRRIVAGLAWRACRSVRLRSVGW